MRNTIYRIRERGFAASLVAVAALTLGGIVAAPAYADDAVVVTSVVVTDVVTDAATDVVTDVATGVVTDASTLPAANTEGPLSSTADRADAAVVPAAETTEVAGIPVKAEPSADIAVAAPILPEAVEPILPQLPVHEEPVYTGTISGSVSVPSGTFPGQITAFSKCGTEWCQMEWTRSDSAGNYALTGLAAGSYAIGFRDYQSSTAFVEEFYDNASTQDDATLVTLADGENKTGIDVELAIVAAPVLAVEAEIPTVTGKAVVGKKLTARIGTWSPTDIDLSYQWLRDNRAVDSATAATYIVTEGDAGHRFSVRVTGSKPGYTSATSTSPSTVSVPIPGKVSAAIELVAGSTNRGNVRVTNASDASVVVTFSIAGKTTTETLASGEWDRMKFRGLQSEAVVSVTVDEEVLASHTVRTPSNLVQATTVNAGTAITVNGSGYQPLEVVEVWLHSTPVLLGTLTANEAGNVSGSFTLLTSTPVGTHHIVLKDVRGGELLSADITVAAAPVATTPVVTTPRATTPAATTPTVTPVKAVVKTAGPAVLATTGTDVTALWYGLAFLLLGGLGMSAKSFGRRSTVATSE